MKLLDIDKALQICGNNNAYQKILFLITVLTWFSVDFVSITFPLLEIQPKYECRNSTSLAYIECEEEEACKTNDFKETIIYNNIFSSFGLSCKTGLVMLIGVTYTIGIFLGAFLGSKFADTFGRKPVILVNNFLFAFSCVALTFAPSIYIIFGILFFTGITCAGGTMITFLMINELLAANKRTVYGTMINSSFALAGIVYFLSFQYVNNWKIIAYISASANIVSIILIMIYAIESPRFLYVSKKYQKFFSELHKVSRINGKSQDFLRYLKSDAVYHCETNGNETSGAKGDNNMCNGSLNYNSAHNSMNKNEKIESDNTNSESLLQDNHNSSSLRSEINFEIQEIIKKYNKLSPKDREKVEDDLTQDLPTKSRSNSVVSNLSTKESSVAPQQEKHFSYMALVKYKSIRYIFLILNFAWFYCCFVYYGISMMLKNFAGNVFTNGYVVYGAEAVSYVVTGIIIALPFFGRVRTLSIMCIINSIACFLYFFIDITPYAEIILFSARFSITSIYSIMYIYTTEVYPTVIRAKGLGINILCARIGSLLVPILVELFSPLIIFSCLGIGTFVLTFYLPETLNKELEDDIEEERKKLDPI